MFDISLLPRPLLIIALCIALIGYILLPIPRARKERMVYSWQNTVTPRWSNITANDFASLRHFLVSHKSTKRRRRRSPFDTRDLEEVQYDREDIVYCVCRKHVMAATGFLPAAFFFVIGVALTVKLSEIDWRKYSTVPLWWLGILMILAALVLGLWVFVEWRYVYYMLTNQAIHIIRQPPLLLAFWPGYHKRLPLRRASMAGTTDSWVGRQSGFTTTQVSTNMGKEEDGPFNNMTYMPVEAEFDVRVNELLGV